MRLYVKPRFPLLALAAAIMISPPVTAAEPSPRNPALDQFNQAITLYASFDGHATADLSGGKGAPTANPKSPQWSQGLWGQSLQNDKRALTYDSAKNIDLSQSGALAIWISPGSWNDSDDPQQIPFVSIFDHGQRLYLARQGGKPNKQALLALYGPDFKDLQTTALVKNGSSADWEAGQWHLLVLNWKGARVELSVDGGPFKGASARHATQKRNDHPDQISLGGGPAAFRMDELLILDRPMGADEVQSLYNSAKARNATPTP